MRPVALLVSLLGHASACWILVLLDVPTQTLQRAVGPDVPEPTVVELIDLPTAPVVREPVNVAPLDPVETPPEDPAPEPVPPTKHHAPPRRDAKPSAPAPTTAQTPTQSTPVSNASAKQARRLDVTLSNAPPTSEPASAVSAPNRAAPASKTCTQKASKPKPIRKSPIGYSAAAKSAELEGRLVLRAAVDRTGQVSGVEVLQSVAPMVDKPAAAALSKWTFEPARACGRAVPSHFTIARNFKLGA